MTLQKSTISYSKCKPQKIVNQILGFTHIGDFNGLSVSHITIWNPTEFTRILKWAEQSVPMRHKEIHLGMLLF